MGRILGAGGTHVDWWLHPDSSRRCQTTSITLRSLFSFFLFATHFGLFKFVSFCICSSRILWRTGGTHVELDPDIPRRCQTTSSASTLRFPNNNSPHFAPNLRHIYSFNLSSWILRLSGNPGSRHSLGIYVWHPARIRKPQKSLKRGDGWMRKAKKVSKRGESALTDPVTTEVVQSPEIRQTYSVQWCLPCFASQEWDVSTQLHLVVGG